MRNELLALGFLLVCVPCARSQTVNVGSRSCLIVKHKGTIGRRLIWTALIGIPIAPGSKYDYVDSIDFQSAKLKYGGKELQGIQQSGVHVIVLNNGFVVSDLDSARRACNESLAPSPAATLAVREDAPTSRPREPSGGDTILGLGGYATDSGFKITSVQAESRAARIYLNPGDIIARIDNRAIHTGADIDAAIQANATGTLALECLLQTSIGAVASEKKVKIR